MAIPISTKILFHPILWITTILVSLSGLVSDNYHAPMWVLLLLALVATSWTPIAASIKAVHGDVGFQVSQGEFQLFGTVLTVLGMLLNGINPILHAAGTSVPFMVTATIGFLCGLVATLANQLKVEAADQPQPVSLSDVKAVPPTVTTSGSAATVTSNVTLNGQTTATGNAGVSPAA